MMISKKRRLRVAVATSAVLAVALAGCSSSSSSKPAAKKKAVILNVYTGASGAFVQNFNPFSPTALSNTKGMMYEGLFYISNLSPLSTKPIPQLGKDYSWNADGTQLTVHMIDGAKWSDGTPITGADAAYTFNAIKAHPALDISGNAPSATANGQTVVLTYKKPSFTDGPGSLITPIAPEHIFSKMTDIEKDTNATPVVSGPMKLGNFTAQSYLLTKNPNYYNAAKVQVAGERFYSLSGNEAGTQKLLAGQLDWSGIFIPDMKKVLAPHKNLGYGETGSNQVVLATCASAAEGCKGPQTDPVVRHAIEAAVDRTQINKLAYYNQAQPISATFGLVPRDNALIAPDLAGVEPQTADVAKAKSLLEGAGWKLGKDGIYAKNGQKLSLTASVVTGWTDYIAVLDAVKAELKAAGIELLPQQQAYASVNNGLTLGKFQLSISSLWQGVAADPWYVYNQFFNSASVKKAGDSTQNPFTDIAKYKNPIVDAAISKGSGTTDLTVKAAAYATIQHEIVRDMPYIPLVVNVQYAQFNTTRVMNFPTPQNQYASTDPGGQASQSYVMNNLKLK